MPDLSIIILSFNRKQALLRTLGELAADPIARDAEIIVVDNASTDESVAAAHDRFPAIKVLSLAQNSGVAGFNRGVDAATRGRVLILDDDSWPDPAALAGAMALLDERKDLHAVALSPVHPTTKRAEWQRLREKRDNWPIMGCGNLIRADAWRAVGGYEESFFLYRNDTDLALKLLGTGMNVHADPAWIVWHDSPAAARKSERWLHLATRNWCWMCRRHGRGVTKYAAIMLGVGWAFGQAGLSVKRLVGVWRGAWDGILSAFPKPPNRPRGTHLAELLRVRLSRRPNRGA